MTTPKGRSGAIAALGLVGPLLVAGIVVVFAGWQAGMVTLLAGWILAMVGAVIAELMRP